MTETIEDIINDEGGIRIEPYRCTAGKATWLIGRNVTDRPLDAKEWGTLADEGLVRGAQILFEYEIDDLNLWYYTQVDNWESLPREVRVIIVNMAYNMGTTRFNPDKWPKFFKAIGERKWRTAADEMKDSKWYRDVGERAERLVESMSKVLD